MTEVTAETRKIGIQAAVEAARAASQDSISTAHAITWKGYELVLPVATVDLDLALLNPHSHRISAQLQSMPREDQETVKGDPFGTVAQRIIAGILESTPGYERIKNALQNDGQLEPGVITTEGVLVNANTRAVALRALREKYISVLVLPADATSKEITDLELRLQMEQEVKQAYSFTSSLLFIEDLIHSDNYTTLEVGKAIRPDLTNSRADNRKAVELVEVELRILGLIREVLASSGGALNFMYFDDKRQALLEIDQDYQRTKTSKPDEAARVRDAQLTGLIAEVDYRKLREVDATLLDSYLPEAMRENVSLQPYLDALLDPRPAPDETVPAGLELLDDEPEASTETSLSKLYELLARSGTGDTMILPAADGSSVELPRQAIAAALHGTFMTAIENKQRDSRRIDDLSAPTVHLKEATRSIDKATKAFTDVAAHPAFDRQEFLMAVAEYQRAVDAFAAEFDAEESIPGTGRAPADTARSSHADG